ncbi:hypothetical protein [Gordonia terrae]|uniref:hypothetical protein n=1 Tax=Gordonia terrae TaxID=2055 RepID=UPI003F6D3B2D
MNLTHHRRRQPTSRSALAELLDLPDGHEVDLDGLARELEDAGIDITDPDNTDRILTLAEVYQS